MPLDNISDHGLREALDRGRGHRCQDKAGIELGAQRLADEDVCPVHARQRLEARCEIDGTADEGIFPPRTGSKQPSESGTLIDADANGDSRQSLAREFGIVIANRGTHGQGSTYRVVTLPRVRLDRPEIRHDAIADVAAHMSAMLVDCIADALIIAVDDAQENLRFQPLAHRGEADEIDEERGRQFALGRRAHVGSYSICDKALHYAGRCKAGAGFLKVLKVRSCRSQLSLEVSGPLPLAIERHGENGGDRRTHGKRQHHEWPITMAPMRQIPLASEVTPITSINCGTDKRSRKPRARR